jgi:peptide/nickel transport system permease protein
MSSLPPVVRVVARYPAGAIAFVFLVGLAAIAIAAPLIAGDPFQISSEIMAPPSFDRPLGTDDLGRDVVSGMIYGARVSLMVGVLAASAATVLGSAIGAVAGFNGGFVDTLVMRIAEIFQVVPSFVLAALIVAVSHAGLTQVIIVISLLAWPQTARLMRGEVLRIKELEFVKATRCLGISERAILFGEIIPNAMAPVIAFGTLIIGNAILLEAALSFLGLSTLNSVSWGQMLNNGQRLLSNAWWLSVFPGAAIFLTVLMFNLLGDALGSVFRVGRGRN